jgi:hypothetical protein
MEEVCRIAAITCPHCTLEQSIKIACRTEVTPGPQKVQCIRCEDLFEITPMGQIIGEAFLTKSQKV